jgi:molecular chaperone DnaJ
MNYYDILGIEKSATQEEVKKAFRKKAMESHPDKGGSEEKFREVSEAYDVLSDDQKRNQYDTTGRVGGGQQFGGHGFNMEDIFSQFGDFFGNPFRQQRQRRGGDLRVQLTVDLLDVMNGGSKKIKYKRQNTCNPCSGRGGTEVKRCLACNGSGERVVSQQTPFGNIQHSTPCNECNATGQKIGNKCSTCKGEGTQLTEETVDINLPKGVANGMNLSMQGFGNHVRDGQPGDLHILINEIRHAKFRREMGDLFCEEWITIPEAVLGTNISIKTLNGDIDVKVDGGCESGKVFTFRNKGVPVLTSNGQNHGVGNLFVTVHVKIPKKISIEEEELYKRLKDI